MKSEHSLVGGQEYRVQLGLISSIKRYPYDEYHCQLSLLPTGGICYL